jgi:mannose-1-phosphate guanylyltransferase
MIADTSHVPATEAVLLVGGLGTRLRPLTDHTAKPMLPVAGVPFLAHQLARLREAGVRHVVMATSYRAETFVGYFGDGREHGLELEYVTETEALGTGGAIRNVADRLRSASDAPVVVVNGDILSDHDIAAQLRLHAVTDATVTLYLTVVDDARAYGCVPTDDAGRVMAFHEKMPEPVSNQINAGCYVFRRSAIDAIPTGRVVSVERETFPGLLRSGARLTGYVAGGYWRDIGTPESYIQGSADLVLGRVASPALPGPVGSAMVMTGTIVAPDAQLTGGCVVGTDSQVGMGAVIDGSILAAGVTIGHGARVHGSAIGAGARVGDRVVLRGVLVGDYVVIDDDTAVAPSARIDTNSATRLSVPERQ